MNARNRNVRLVKVDIKNFDDLIGLKVNESQRGFVAPNMYSLAEAKEIPEGWDEIPAVLKL